MSGQQADQIFLLDQVSGILNFATVRQLHLAEDNLKQWHLKQRTEAPVRGISGDAGERTTALTTADVDGDGQDELIAFHVKEITGYEIEQDGLLEMGPADRLRDGRNISLATGDINRDGRDEIVASTTGQTQYFYYTDGLLAENTWVPRWGDVLIGELDGDSDVAELTGCEDIRDVLMDGAGATVDAGERIQYRLNLHPDEEVALAMNVTAGEAQLSAWKPRNGFAANYFGNGITGQVKMTFQAPEPGLYLFEVGGLADGATYTLQRISAEEEDTARANAHRAVQVDDHPLTLSTPFSLDPADVIRELGPIYLPVVANQDAVIRRTENHPAEDEPPAQIYLPKVGR